MKRLALVLLAAVVVFMPACDDDNPTNPTAALPLRFTADLKAANEVNPSVTNSESGATGSMTLTVTVTRDSASNITAVNSLEFIVSNIAGLTAPATLTGAHIHAAPAGQSAGVFINTGLTNGEVVLASGTGSFTKTVTSGVTVEQVQSLVANPAGNYFNVHTQLNPSGAIRGQLVRVQ
jgi:hypothetical protein